jgi:hypothetical protein
MSALASLTSFISLDLTGCKRVSDNGMIALASLTSLTGLDLTGCEQVSDNGMSALASLTSLTGWPRLDWMVASKCRTTG